MVDVLFEWVYY